MWHWVNLPWLSWAVQWKGINRNQSTRWQHLSQFKASTFFSLQFFSCYETQQLILGTGTAIWWVTEPHYNLALSKEAKACKAILAPLSDVGVATPVKIAIFSLVFLMQCNYNAMYCCIAQGSQGKYNRCCCWGHLHRDSFVGGNAHDSDNCIKAHLHIFI